MTALSKESGGSAFPVSDLNTHGTYGMSLRDYFAAAALQGMLASGHQDGIEKLAINAGGSPTKGVSLAAYGFADAMLKARAE